MYTERIQIDYACAVPVTFFRILSQVEGTHKLQQNSPKLNLIQIRPTVLELLHMYKADDIILADAPVCCECA